MSEACKRGSVPPGVLVVDKPGGMTSAAVVAEVKRALGGVKVGHTGTLDPMATGVLPLCLGEATKLATFLLADDKRYEGELCLGVETDTLDADGEVTARAPEAAAAVGREQLAAAMAALVGDSEQVPPMYSALKQGGRRLHELARAGQAVERPPRPIRVDRFELVDVSPPRARFDVACSKGTYVRSLVADLGRALGCGAHLTALRRTQSGRFAIDQAVPLAEIGAAAPVDLPVVDPAAALAHLPAAPVAAELVAAVRDGKPLPWQVISPEPAPAGLVRLLTPAGRLLALAEIDRGRLRFARVFTYGLT